MSEAILVKQTSARLQPVVAPIGVAKSLLSLKFLKLQDDPCFGKKHEQIPQCESCFIKQSCLVRFRNTEH